MTVAADVRQSGVARPELEAARRPAPPDSLAATGLSEGVVSDLLLKILYARGALMGETLAEASALPFALIDDVLLTLQHRRFIEVRGTSGPNRHAYHFDLGTAGRDRAREALERCQYVGPAPVPLAQYVALTAAQSVVHARVGREALAAAFLDVVMPASLLDALGPAVNSGKSLFLFGSSGDGKTMIAERLATLLGGEILVPYAVEHDGQIMTVFDPAVHAAVAPEPDEAGGALALLLRREGGVDRRYVRVRRPVVITGGELTLDQLDLRYDPHTKLYAAPFQMKANGGVLIVDDFGRQRVPPRELLNRWIVPLEKRVDYLTLHTGGKFAVPFDALLIFATNLEPSELVEEAFLRRIHYKLRVQSPDRAQYEAIFSLVCASRSIAYDAAAVGRVYDRVYASGGIVPRACHPRDIVDHVLDEAGYLGVPPTLSAELVDRACNAYFLDISAHGGHA